MKCNLLPDPFFSYTGSICWTVTSLPPWRPQTCSSYTGLSPHQITSPSWWIFIFQYLIKASSAQWGHAAVLQVSDFESNTTRLESFLLSWFWILVSVWLWTNTLQSFLFETLKMNVIIPTSLDCCKNEWYTLRKAPPTGHALRKSGFLSSVWSQIPLHSEFLIVSFSQLIAVSLKIRKVS